MGLLHIKYYWISVWNEVSLLKIPYKNEFQEWYVLVGSTSILFCRSCIMGLVYPGLQSTIKCVGWETLILKLLIYFRRNPRQHWFNPSFHENKDSKPKRPRDLPKIPNNVVSESRREAGIPMHSDSADCSSLSCFTLTYYHRTTASLE